ncbi:MAG: pyridoxal phosphate-dependent aminotransferase [Dehalococcoidales bacterium]|nr:pyridoxal phosphate-dependent aminotransferase [Dehalococcoidales bacterium]
MSISEKAKKGIIAGAYIRRMFEEGIALKKVYGDDNVFDYSIGNPLMEPPAAFKGEIKRLAEYPVSGMHRYMENAGYNDTRAAVAEQLQEETGIKYSMNEVVMAAGAAGALNITFKALLNPGEEVICFAPHYFEYDSYVDNHNGIVKSMPFDENFNPDFNVFEDSLTTRTKAVVITSPNNPTGTVFSVETLKTIAEIITRRSAKLNTRIYIVSDDVYSRIYFDGPKCPRIVSYYPHSIIATSYSKDLSLPGERIGYAAVHPDCENAREVSNGLIYANRVLGFINAPAFMQNAVCKVQGSCVDIDEYRRKRDFLYDNLTGMGYSVVKPQGAFYIFPKAPIADDTLFARELQQLRILVVLGSGFKAPGYFRISYCCIDDKHIEGSFKGLRQAIEKYRN